MNILAPVAVAAFTVVLMQAEYDVTRIPVELLLFGAITTGVVWALNKI